jgi:hypothetical protein
MRKSLRAVRPGLGAVLLFLITWSQLALVAGCGGHSGTPLSPSASPAPASSPAPATAPAAPGATITATVASGGSSPVLEATPDVTLNGSIASLGGTCPVLSLSVAGTPVKTNSATVFNARACGELRSGDTVYAMGPQQADGSVLASRIYYVAPERASAPAPIAMPVEVTVSGEISGFTGTCLAITVTVSGTLVKASTATTFSGTKGCSGLQNGDAVSVVGTQQSDGSLLASKISYTGPAPVTDTTLNGPVVGLTGTCPALTLSVAGTPVKTNSATVFNNRACAELGNGDTVYALGPKQSDGSVLASRIYYVAPTAVEVTVSGTISGFTGTCLSVSLTVSGTLVKTNSATTFSGTKGCSLLQNGDAVTAVGTKQSDGSVLATRITYTGPAPVPETSLNGAVVGLGGTCPALTLSVAGTPVKTNSATVFNNKTCAELRNGDTVYAIGPKQSNGSVLASRIYYVAPVTTPPTPIYVTGTVGSTEGTCPALTLNISGTVVKTSSATVFTGKACADIVTGSSLNTSNTRQTDGSLLANYVQVVK